MLSNTRITITSETLNGSTRAASYTALLDLTNKKVTLNIVHSDDNFKETTREDQENFEAYAYSVLDQIASQAPPASQA